jgi:hypothetical protein
MPDHEDNDALLTEDQAREELGREFDEAVESGELRRVSYAGSEFVLRGDVERIRDENDPVTLAKRVRRL